MSSFIKWKEDYWEKEDFAHPSQARSQADKLMNLCRISGNQFPKTAGASYRVEDQYSLKLLIPST